MAIFIAIIIEKISNSGEHQPRAVTYIMALIFSTLVSLTFFRVSRIGSTLNWSAFLFLALSMGVVAIAVIRALNNPTCKTSKAVWIASLYLAVPIGVLAAFFQTMAVVSFAGIGHIAQIESIKLMTVTALYGWVKGSVVTFIVGYQIMESIRIQLILAQRAAPRVRFKTRLSALTETAQFDITIRNISRGGHSH